MKIECDVELTTYKGIDAIQVGDALNLALKAMVHYGCDSENLGIVAMLHVEAMKEWNRHFQKEQRERAEAAAAKKEA